MITLDKNLGVTGSDHGTQVSGVVTQTLTTGAAAASGTRIVVGVNYWSTSGGTPLRVSGVTDSAGGVYTRDAPVHINANGSDITEVWSRIAPAGLASSAVITVTFAPNASVPNVIGGAFLGASSWFGITGVDATTTSDNSGTNWSSGSASNSVADALFYGIVGIEDPTNPTTSTATNGTELHDFFDASSLQGMAAGYLLPNGKTTAAITGTLSNSASTVNTGMLVVYSGSPDASPPNPLLSMLNKRGRSRAVALQLIALARSAVPAASGPVFAVVTASDSLGTTDSVTRAGLLTRTASDTLGTTDSAVGNKVLPRTAVDTLGTTDSADRAALLRTRTATDSLNTTDAAARSALSLSRTAADTLSTTDSATRAALLRTRTAADSLGTTDSAVRAALLLTRTAADSLGTTDSISGGKLLTRTAADTLGTTDSAARAALLLTRTAADSLGTTDSAVRAALLRTRTAADTLGTTDSAAGGKLLTRTAADTLGTTDSAARAALLRIRTAADSLNTTDSVVRAALLRTRTAADSLGTTDSAAGGKLLTRTAADSLGTTDSAVRAALLRIRTAADALGTTDSASRTLLRIRTAADSLGTTDSAVGVRGGASPDALETLVATIIKPQNVATITGDGLTNVIIDSGTDATIATTNPTYREFALSGTPLLYYTLDEPSVQNVADIAGTYDGMGTNLARNHDSALPRGGGRAAQFNGSGSYITVPSGFPTLAGSAFSFSLWIKTFNYFQVGQQITAFYDSSPPFAGWGLVLNRTGSNVLSYWSGTTGSWVDSTVAAITDSNWHNVVVTVSAAGSVKFYIAGELTDTVSSNAPNSWTGAKYMGMASDLTTRPLAGTMDEIAIYDYALDPGFIRQAYLLGIDTFNDYGLRTAEVVDTIPDVTVTAPHETATIVAAHNTALIAHS